MRICLLSYSWLTEDPPILNLGAVLAERGHRVLALGRTCPGQPDQEEPTPGFTIRRLGTRGRGPLPGSVYALSALARALSFTPDAIVAMNWNSLVVGYVASRFVGARLYYYQLEFNELPRGSRHRIGVASCLRAERLIARRADGVFSVEPERARLAAKEFRLKTVPSVVLNAPRAGASVGLAATTQRLERSIVYAGAISPTTCIGEVLAALELLPSPVSFDLYGRVAPGFAEELEVRANRCRAKGHQIRGMGLVAYGALPGHLQLYSLGIAFYRELDENHRLAAPGKVFEYLKAGLPFVGSPSPLLESLVARLGCGACVNPSNTDALAALLGKLLRDGPRLNEMGLRGRAAFFDELNYDKQVKPLLSSIEGQ